MAILKPIDRQAIRDWSVFYQNFLAEVTLEANETEEQKRKRMEHLEANFEEWKKYYFPKYCYAPAAPFHMEASRRILDNPEWYESRVWARELAKDALCMMETLFQVLTGIKSNIILISNSWDKASELLEPYRINLEKNERIINDYGIQKNPGSWSYGDFVTVSGGSFLAVGADQSPRGSRNEEVRPDKVIVSDIDTDQDVLNIEIINKRWKWFEKAVYPTRSVSKPFQVIWLGNLIAKDCCVVRAMKMADYVDIVNLEDEKGNSTWPEKNKPEHIARIKSKMSTAAYQSEYMNNPVSEGNVFKNLIYDKVPDLKKFKYLVIYGDPAPGENKKKTSCAKCVCLLGKKDSKLYIIKGYVGKELNSVFIDWYIQLLLFVNGKTNVYCWMENNKLQDPFFKQVFKPLVRKAKKKYNIALNIKGDEERKTDKATRIESNLEPLDRDGELIFNESEKNNPHMQEIVEQFKLFELTMPYEVAGPDTVEGGKRILEKTQQELIPNDTINRKVIRNKNRHRR